MPGTVAQLLCPLRPTPIQLCAEPLTGCCPGLSQLPAAFLLSHFLQSCRRVTTYSLLLWQVLANKASCHPREA